MAPTNRLCRSNSPPWCTRQPPQTAAPLTPPRNPSWLQLEVASGLDEYRKRAEGAESKIVRLDEDNIRLNRENERLRDQVDALTEQLAPFERELRDERQARQDATEALARMKTNFERAEDQLAR